MASIKKILMDSFEEVKEDTRLVHEINKANLETVKAINRANIEEARRFNREIRDMLTDEDYESEATPSSGDAPSDDSEK